MGRGASYKAAPSVAFGSNVVGHLAREIEVEMGVNPKVHVDDMGDMGMTAAIEAQRDEALQLTTDFDPITGGRWNSKGRLRAVSEATGWKYGIAVRSTFKFIVYELEVNGMHETAVRNVDKSRRTLRTNQVSGLDKAQDSEAAGKTHRSQAPVCRGPE